MATYSSFIEALTSRAIAPEIPPEDNVYGWLIGSWTLEIAVFGKDGEVDRSAGEVHFSWALQGRAVQDVWIGRSTVAGHGMFGTTIRIYDPALKAWRVTWVNPVSGAHDELVGRRPGADIVQEGKSKDGTPIRWCFTDITPDSFRWTGERILSDGADWTLHVEMHARRVK